MTERMPALGGARGFLYWLGLLACVHRKEILYDLANQPDFAARGGGQVSVIFRVAGGDRREGLFQTGIDSYSGARA